jgi:hypothetical protein
VEDLARDLDGGDHCREAFVEEHDGSRTARRVRRALDGDSTVRLLQRWRVVHAVARHGRQMSATWRIGYACLGMLKQRHAPRLEHLDDLVFVLGEYFRCSEGETATEERLKRTDQSHRRSPQSH